MAVERRGVGEPDILYDLIQSLGRGGNQTVILPSLLISVDIANISTRKWMSKCRVMEGVVWFEESEEDGETSSSRSSIICD